MTLIAALILSLAQDQDRIQDLIRKLGSDEFETREKATEELKKAGKSAKDALTKAAEESDDPEVRQRSKTILEEMAKAERPQPRRIPLPQPGQGFGFRGSSVTIRSVNGDSVYTITPGDGNPPLTFHKAAAGAVKLEYADNGETKAVEAPTLEAFLKDHKELAQRFGISEEGIQYSGSRVTFKGNGMPDFNFPRIPRIPRPAPRVPPPAPPQPLEDEAEGVPVAGARLGVVDDSLRAQLDIPEKQGAVVLGVTPGSPADALGLRKNDVLLEIDGKKITSPESAKGLVTKESAGTVLRKGRKVAIGATKDF